MAIIQAYGFDVYDDVAELFNEPAWSEGSRTRFATTGGRFGGGRFHFTSGTSNPTLFVNLAVPSKPGPTIYIGFAMTRSTWGTNDIFDMLGSGSQHMRFNSNSGLGTIDVYRLGVFQDRFQFPSNSWHWIEIKLLIDDTIGELIVKLDEVTVFEQIGVDTQSGGSQFVDVIRWLSDELPDTVYSIDDVIIHNNADFIGDHRIETLRVFDESPQIDFNPSAGSNNAAMVDEAPGADNDTTYVESSTPGHQDLYSATTFTGLDPVDITAVIVRGKIKKDDAGSRSIKFLANTGTIGNTAITALSTDYQYADGIFETDPSTDGAPFTKANVNAIEIGFEVV